MSYTVEGELKVGQSYMICTGTIGRYATFRGVARCKGSCERILLFEDQHSDFEQRRFIGAIVDLHLPYHTESIVKITGQLVAKYYGSSLDSLKPQGISQEEWEMT